MKNRMILLLAMSLIMTALFLAPALSAQVTEPDADHNIKTDPHGCWFNPLKNGMGHFEEESGVWKSLEEISP